MNLVCYHKIAACLVLLYNIHVSDWMNWLHVKCGGISRVTFVLFRGDLVRTVFISDARLWRRMAERWWIGNKPVCLSERCVITEASSLSVRRNAVIGVVRAARRTCSQSLCGRGNGVQC